MCKVHVEGALTCLSVADTALDWYIEDFGSHVNDTIQRLQGHVKKPKKEQPLLPSKFGWSESCNLLFFAALSRHSRHRPDLIASDCQRPEWEIAAYLDALRDALTEPGQARTATADLVKEEEPKTSQLGKHFKQGRAPATYEVSDEWIEQEESLARQLDDPVRQREIADNEDDTRRTRRADRRAIREEVHQMGLPYSQRKRVKRERLSELDQAFARQEWDKELDAEKLQQLDEMALSIMPDPLDRGSHTRSRSRSRLSTADPMHRARSPSLEEVPLDGASQSSDRQNLLPLSAFQLRIQEEEAHLASLKRIDKSLLTAAQRKEVAKLVRRKLDRDRYRRRKYGTPETVGAESAGEEAESMIQPKIKSDKHRNIALDNAVIQRLSAIKRHRRTTDQADQLRVLKRQRRKRRRRRLKTLLNRGITQEDIDSQGGIDAAYLISRGMGADTEDPSLLSDTEVERRMTQPAVADNSTLESGGVAPDTNRPTTQPPYPHDAATREVIRSCNLDIINYSGLAERLDGRTIPFSMVRDCHQQLLRHLKSLVRQSILLAEAEISQTVDELGVTDRHVYQVIELRQDPAYRSTQPDSEVDASSVDGVGGSQSDSDDDHAITDEEDEQLDELQERLDEAMDAEEAMRLARSTDAAHSERSLAVQEAQAGAFFQPSVNEAYCC